MRIKKNISLILGLSVPVLMIILIAASIYLPGVFIKPKFNFLYYTGDNYCSVKQYSVQGEKLVELVEDEVKSSSNFCVSSERSEVKLFVHDIVNNINQQISFSEAQKYSLDSNPKSSDGFEIVYGGRGDGFFPFFFWSNQNYNTRYLTGRNISKKLNIQISGNYYDGFHFLGWIKED